MEKIFIDTYTERLLLKRMRNLIKYIPYDVFARIEEIVNEAVNNHYFFRYRLEELAVLLQEAESQKKCEENRTEQRDTGSQCICMTSHIRKDNTVFYNQIYDYEVDEYKRMIIMMLTGKVNVDDKSKNNGIAL